MVRIFFLGLFLFLNITYAGELNILGQNFSKTREKGKIVSHEYWSPLPPVLDENMGTYHRLKFSKPMNELKSLELSFAGIIKSIKIEDGLFVDKGFDFSNYYHKNLYGKDGVLSIKAYDNNKNVIFQKKIKIRGDAG